jgi:hypothetical protein
VKGIAMPRKPNYQFFVHYIDRLFEKDREARDAALHALESSQRNAASKVEFYLSIVVALVSLIVAILKK